MLDIAALLITLTAVFAYLNHRYVRLPTTIGVMVISLVLSLGLVGLSSLGYGRVERDAQALLEPGRLRRGADARHAGVPALRRRAPRRPRATWPSRKWPIAILATVGVLISTALVGLAVLGGSSALLGLPRLARSTACCSAR